MDEFIDTISAFNQKISNFNSGQKDDDSFEFQRNNKEPLLKLNIFSGQAAQGGDIYEYVESPEYRQNTEYDDEEDQNPTGSIRKVASEDRIQL